MARVMYVKNQPKFYDEAHVKWRAYRRKYQALHPKPKTKTATEPHQPRQKDDFNSYLLDKFQFKRLIKRYGDPKCHACGEALREGDRVVSRPRRHRKKLFHLDCWKGLFVAC